MAAWSFFAVTAPGLAALAAAELRALGLAPAEPEPGGVAFGGPLEAAYRANLWLRTASRVLARVDEFSARTFWELDKQARRLPWERFLRPGQSVSLRVTCHKSRLYHSDAVGERIARAIEARLGRASEFTTAGAEDQEEHSAPLVVVRLWHDRCALSVDSTGALLHLRGYRQATAKAPLRETLAAAMILASGWAAALPAAEACPPLIDPMCGAGTIAIEAALLTRGIAPGLNRRFAFMDWPGFDGALWDRLLDEAHGTMAPAAMGPILASDRDAGAIDAARANAERAGVAGDIAFRECALSAIEPPPGRGWLITNPPYGVRVGERDRLRNLYATLGNVARRRCAGYTLVFLTADEALGRQVGLPVETVLQTANGGIAVQALRAEVPA